jgi:peptidoglycan hydrolase-like protein with peptidoglycan-binding domain
MTQLTDVQIAQYANAAGIRNAGLPISVAVAIAESDGKTDAVNTKGNTPPSRDRGVWQINDYWHSEVSDAEAFDPAQAAIETARITKNGTNWHEWATYNHGTYLKYMDRGRAAAAIVTGNPFILTRYLRKGMTGADVAACQTKVGVKSDGDFGPLTEQAVRDWQHTFFTFHLDSDGIVGPLTCRSFNWTWKG